MTADWNYDSDGDQNAKEASKISRKKQNSRSKSPEANTSGSNDFSKEVNSRPKTNPTPDPSTCIGIFGLSKKTDERTLWKTFENFGKIKSVSLIVDKFTKESLGFAFINYEELDSATNAIKETNGMSLDSKVIRVDYSLTKKAYTPTPGSGYKGKNISRRMRDSKRNMKRKYSPQSRSRSSSRKRSAMKYLNGRNSPNNLTCSRVPIHFSESRNSYRRYESRKHSPEPRFSMQYSPQRNMRGYSPPSNIARAYSPMNREYRGFSPNRDARRNDFSNSYARAYSPVRNSSKMYSQRNWHQECSPRNHLRGISPFKTNYREFSPSQTMKVGFPPIHHDINEYTLRQVREFSPVEKHSFRNGVHVYSPVKGFRGNSPIRKDVRIYSPKREHTPVRFGYRQYSPVRVEKFKDHATIDNQRFFY